MYPRKRWRLKKWDNVVKIHERCIWFNFRYALVELFHGEPLKIILLDEGNERGDSVNQH